jgi:hypothetical protein
MITSAFLVISVVGLLLVRRYVPHHKLKVHNDVAGAIYNTLGVAYTVMLAFVMVIAWQGFDKSNANVEKEANCLSDLFRNSTSFPKVFRDDLRSQLKEYGITLVRDEWKKMALGQVSQRANEIMREVWKKYSSYEPVTENEKIFLAESVRKLNEMSELRRLRLMDSRTGIHSVIWFVLIVGGVLTIIFTFFFGSENWRAQILMASMLAVIISLMLYTILLLDFPFTGGVQIGPDAFKQLVEF